MMTSHGLQGLSHIMSDRQRNLLHDICRSCYLAGSDLTIIMLPTGRKMPRRWYLMSSLQMQSEAAPPSFLCMSVQHASIQLMSICSVSRRDQTIESLTMAAQGLPRLLQASGSMRNTRPTWTGRLPAEAAGCCGFCGLSASSTMSCTSMHRKTLSKNGRCFASVQVTFNISLSSTPPQSLPHSDVHCQRKSRFAYTTGCKVHNDSMLRTHFGSLVRSSLSFRL